MQCNYIQNKDGRHMCPAWGMRDSGGLKYFLTDHLGSILAVLDDQGEVLTETRYMPPVPEPPLRAVKGIWRRAR